MANLTLQEKQQDFLMNLFNEVPYTTFVSFKQLMNKIISLKKIGFYDTKAIQAIDWVGVCNALHSLTASGDLVRGFKFNSNMPYWYRIKATKSEVIEMNKHEDELLRNRTN